MASYDFWISQGSLATVLRWGRLNYNHFSQVSLWCCRPKIIQIGQCFTELFMARFLLRHSVEMQWQYKTKLLEAKQEYMQKGSLAVKQT